MPAAPRRILLLITDLEIGGTPTVVRELAIRLREPVRVAVEVACLGRWGPVADQLSVAGVKVTAFGATSPVGLPRTAWRLIRLIRGGRFDTVFSFLIHANATAALASIVCPGLRFIQSIQTTQPRPRWHWHLQRLVRVAADRLVVPSPSAAAVARRWAGVPAGRIVVIPNAVDVSAFGGLYAERLAGRDHPRLAGDPVRVGFLGRLDPVKRVPDLIAAAARLPAVHIHLFGDGADRDRIARRAAELAMTSRVTFHGAVAGPLDALRAIDVLVLPSEAEGFGLVLIEAMAAGVPVVATDVPGIRDVVADGRTGWLVPVGDVGRLAEAIAAADGRFIVAARAAVEQRFAWPPVLLAYRQLLRLEQ